MFQLSGLDPAPFAHLFELDDAALRRLSVERRIADAAPGYPCRVSLEDAAVGEELLLLPWVHHAVDSPYQASGPILVRRGARRAQLAPGAVPEYVARRLMSLRAYDAAHGMVDADVVPGIDVAAALSTLFEREEIAYVHLHNARRGCYSCLATRAG